MKSSFKLFTRYSRNTRIKGKATANDDVINYTAQKEEVSNKDAFSFCLQQNYGKGEFLRRFKEYLKPKYLEIQFIFKRAL